MLQSTTEPPVQLTLAPNLIARFDATPLTSDGGIPLVALFDQRLGLTKRLAALLPDHRNPVYVQHTNHDLLRQRVYAIVAGYEDGNDAKYLRMDPALKIAVGRRIDDPDEDLASQPSLSRFEARATRAAQYRMHEALVDDWLARRKRPKRLILDFDSTWDTTYGGQQQTFFNGFYDSYGYHPLLVFDAETGELVVALLRPGSADAPAGALAILKRLVAKIRAKWPGTSILFRADAGFARPDIYDWCEDHGVAYLIGLQVNPVLKRESANCLTTARRSFLGWAKALGRQGKSFCEFSYRAKTWRQARRVIAKAEFGFQGENQRFLVTNLKGRDPRQMYAFYCKRGDAENRIKDFKNALFADRLSCTTFRANAFRLLVHAVAYRLCMAMRQALAGTAGANWQFDTLRLRLFKVAARIDQTARKAVLHLPRCYPHADLWGVLATALGPPVTA